MDQPREDCGQGGAGGCVGRKERAAGHGESGGSGEVKGQLLWAPGEPGFAREEGPL